MKKILPFLLFFFFVACSSDEPVIDDKVDSSSSNVVEFSDGTITFEPYNSHYIKEKYCDIICVIKEDVVAVPLNMAVYLKDGDSVITSFMKGYDNLGNYGTDSFYSKRYGVQSYGYGLNNIPFNRVKEIIFLYSTLDDKQEQIYKTVLLYGDGKKCNKVLRSFFK